MKLRMAVLFGLIALTIPITWMMTKPAPVRPSVEAAVPPPRPAARPETRPRPARPAGAASNKVVATVYGEPIREAEVMEALPDDAFDATLDQMKRGKLRRLIGVILDERFLKEHQIAVTEAEVDKGIDDFRRMVMTPGCSCCGGNFKSLEQYMRINGYTMAELRRQIRCDLGIKGYEERLTLERTSPAILAEAADRDHGQIEANYVQARAILFDNRKAPEYYRDEQAAAAGKETQARKAWERLQKGDTFERVAREMSDDTASAAKGGALGVVRADVLGEEVEQVLHELEPGICSGVVKANWGCCIVMRQKLTEGDVLSVVRDQAKEVVEAQLYQKLRTAREEADIQYLDESLKPIVATTAPSSRPN